MDTETPVKPSNASFEKFRAATADIKPEVKPAEVLVQEVPKIASAEPVEHGSQESQTPQPKPVETQSKGLLEGMGKALPKQEFKKQEVISKEENLTLQRKIIEDQSAKIKELEAKGSTPPEDYEELKKNYEFTTKELAKIKIEATPEFQKKYKEPLDKAMGSIERSLLSVKMDDSERSVFKNEFVALVQAPDSPQRTQKLSEMLESVDKLTEKKLISSITDYESTREQRESELKDPTETYNKYREQEEAERKVQAERNFKVIDEVLQKASEKVPFLKKQEGNEPWNAMVEEIGNTARHIWRQPVGSIENQAEIAVMAATAPRLYHGLTMAYAEIERLNTELSQHTQSIPNTVAGGKSSSPSATPKSGVERFKEATKELKAS